MNGTTGQAQQGHEKRRLPTFERALQCTPLTSIVPFDTNIVPVPDAVPNGYQSTSLDEEEEKTGRQLLQTLDIHASSPGDTSVKLEKTLRNLRQLLEGQDLGALRFRTPVLPHAPNEGITPSEQAAHSATSIKGRKSSLGPFAKMFMERRPFDLRHSPPLSKHYTHDIWPKVSASPTTVAGSKVADLSPKLTNGNHAVPQNKQSGPAALRPALQHQPRAQDNFQTSKPKQGPSSQEFAVVVPTIGSQGPALHKAVGGSQVEVHIPTTPLKRERSEIQDSQETDTGVVARVHPALVNMQELMLSLFEAEDHAEPDTSGALPKNSQHFFMSNDDTKSKECILQAEMQRQLDSTIAKVLDGGVFRDLAVDHLARVEKICARSLTLMGEDDIVSFDQAFTAGAADRWEEQAVKVECGLLASKTLLRIMTAAEDDKQLQSEEVLQALLSHLRMVMENFVVPLVETQASRLGDGALQLASSLKSVATSLMKRAGSVVKFLGDFASAVDLSEASVTTIEFLATKLIFLENATTEKESLLGIQKFESLRRHAMDLLASIYLRRPEQRSHILNEILSSLEKLPTTRQSARQFKIPDGKPIQLVSALVMRLVQTTAMWRSEEPTSGRRVITHEQDGDEEDSEDSEESDSDNGASRKTTCKQASSEFMMNGSGDSAVRLLEKKIKASFDGAQNSAVYLTGFLIQRALNSTKTGDQPYRNLLDIFTEDFVNVLGCPEWPAAELLLRSILSHLIRIVENDKSSAPSKNMALDLMGIMGSEIADLRLRLRRSCKADNAGLTKRTQQLSALCEDSLSDELSEDHLLSLQGPWPILLQSLQSSGEAKLLLSAHSYNVSQWGRIACTTYVPKMEDEVEEDPSKELQQFRSLATHLLAVMKEPQTVLSSDTEPVTATEARLAHGIVLLNLPFCRAFRKVFYLLLTSLTSSQATVRSRSLKSVIQFLEKDPSLLDRGTLSQITRCAADTSPMVRDSALALVGKCMTINPTLETPLARVVMERTVDTAVGVRKRAMRLLKDVCLRNSSQELQSAIAESILSRVNDTDDSVGELAQQIMEDVWILPFLGDDISKSASGKQQLYSHAALVTRTAHRGDAVCTSLETCLGKALAGEAKASIANREVCMKLVETMFEFIVDSTLAKEVNLSQLSVIQTLAILAKACPQLFISDQMTILQPYIEHLATNDDLLVYRSVIAIYRCVLPTLPPMSAAFLKAVQDRLFSSVSKLPKLEMYEVAACLWIINGVLQNTSRLVKLQISVVQGILAATKGNDSNHVQDEATMTRLKRFIMIAGHLGHACDLEDYAAAFRERFTGWKGDSVSGFVVDTIVPLTKINQTISLREMALESVCLICQAWPKNYLKSDVTASFEAAFTRQEESLELVVLSSIRTFYLGEEERSRSGAAIRVGNGASMGAQRLGKSMTLSDNDGAATSIAQQFLPYILAIATASYDELALLATEVIVSTNRQGLVHPKETGVTLVVLETSPNKDIASAAFDEHRSLHQKHESMLEKEYLKAVELAFVYHRDTINDISGTETRKSDSALPKLHLFWEVLKTGSVALRKKLLSNLCAKLDVNLSKLAEPQTLLTHVQYVCFIAVNLALFEYARVDELLQVCDGMDKVFANTGNALSQHIEAEFNMRHGNGTASGDSPMEAAAAHTNSDVRKLQQLTMVATIMTMLSETRARLRRSWSLASHLSASGAGAGRTAKAAAARDTTKAPTRSSAATPPERYLDTMRNLAGRADPSTTNTVAMQQRCRAFLDLAAVDAELRVAPSDDADSQPQRFQTPASDAGGSGEQRAASGTPGGRKRRASSSAAGTPRKARAKRGGGRVSVGAVRRKSSAGGERYGDDEDDGGADDDGGGDSWA